MAYSPATIANFFLDKASREQRAVTPMQLLKLVYIAHGWHLGYFDRPLIDETVQAWKYGPVIKSLYDKLKQYGSGAVREPVQTGPMPWMRDSAIPDPNTAALLDSVWQSYAGYSGIQLSAMTHQSDTPWSVAWHQQGGHRQYFAEIDNELIRQHYKAKIASSTAQPAHA
jgi:uncharacterized phage-associated protein